MLIFGGVSRLNWISQCSYRKSKRTIFRIYIFVVILPTYLVQLRRKCTQKVVGSSPAPAYFPFFGIGCRFVLSKFNCNTLGWKTAPFITYLAPGILTQIS